MKYKNGEDLLDDMGKMEYRIVNLKYGYTGYAVELDSIDREGNIDGKDLVICVPGIGFGEWQ